MLLCDDVVLSHIGVADSPISSYSIDQDESAGPFVAKKGKRKEETASISAPKSSDTISLYSTFRRTRKASWKATGFYRHNADTNSYADLPREIIFFHVH